MDDVEYEVRLKVRMTIGTKKFDLAKARKMLSQMSETELLNNVFSISVAHIREADQ